MPEPTRRPSQFVHTDGVFRKCDACGSTVPTKDVAENLDVCVSCGHHFPVGAQRRVEITLDEGSFAERFADIEPVDALGFSCKRTYAERLVESQRKTGLKDAVLTGTGRVEEHEVVFIATDSRFMMGSMGSVVGEKITRAFEAATVERLPVVLFSGSGGGARMDEGVLSLMQMAKTAAAIGVHSRKNLGYITVITNPTYGGASASFATLGDVLIGEPHARMGFTGPRVIRETLRVELPGGFQEAEFLLEHGQLDMIVERSRMRKTLGSLLEFLS